MGMDIAGVDNDGVIDTEFKLQQNCYLCNKNLSIIKCSFSAAG